MEVDALRKYCQQRGLAVGGSKRKELGALAYAAYSQNYPVVKSKESERADANRQYADLLTLDDVTVIPDPFGTESLRSYSFYSGRKMYFCSSSNHNFYH